MLTIKRLIVTALFLLIATLLFSQEPYPRKILLGKDTVVVITSEQVVLINELCEDGEFYEEQYNDALNALNKVDSICKEQEKGFNKSIELNKNLMVNLKRSHKSIDELNESLIKEQKKSKRNLYIGGVGGVIVTSLIVFLVK